MSLRGNSSPAVTADVAFVTTGAPVRVFAVNTSDCSFKWKFDAYADYGDEGDYFSSPAIATVNIPGRGLVDVVFVFSDGQNLYAIDASDGTLIWSKGVDDTNHDRSIISSPTVTTVPINGVSTQVVYLGLSYAWAFRADTGDPLSTWNGGGVPGRSVDAVYSTSSTPTVISREELFRPGRFSRSEAAMSVVPTWDFAVSSPTTEKHSGAQRNGHREI